MPLDTHSKSICTIIAKNYLAFARTLCNSFLRQHPDGVCYVLIIDDIEGYLDRDKEKFEIVTIGDLGISRLTEFCFKYDITELATAAKPYLLQYLFAQKGMNELLYLDPDILVTAPLDELFGELQRNDIILTPHLDKDYPDDGWFPIDANIMISGIFNLGFIGVRRCDNVGGFLTWWQDKLYSKCVIAPSAGYFVDQKFIDLAITLFPGMGIIKDTGYNAAYWNIHSREITKFGEEWRCNGRRLYFFHFSNYKPERAGEISGHQNRFTFDDMPQLRILFDEYYRMLMDNGYSETFVWQYSYNFYTNGNAVKNSDRIKYRKCLPDGSLDNPFVQEMHPVEKPDKSLKNMLLRRPLSFARRVIGKIK